MDPETTMLATGICALDTIWNKLPIRHYFSVVPKLPYSVHIGGDMLLRLAVQIDMVNNIPLDSIPWTGTPSGSKPQQPSLRSDHP